MPRTRRALLQKQKDEGDFEISAFRDVEGKPVEDKLSDESDSDEGLPELDDETSEEEADDLELGADRLGDGASDDDSDDMPEDVGFSESREMALVQMKQVMTQMKADKDKEKSKRKQRDELYKDQKRLKLESCRLPDDVINSLPDSMEEIPTKTKKSQKKKEKKEKHKKGTPQKDNVSSQKPREYPDLDLTEDFIPLETGIVNRDTGIRAVPILGRKKLAAVSEVARDFRKDRLHGDQRRRQTTKEFLSVQDKRKALKHYKQKR